MNNKVKILIVIAGAIAAWFILIPFFTAYPDLLYWFNGFSLGLLVDGRLRKEPVVKAHITDKEVSDVRVIKQKS